MAKQLNIKMKNSEDWVKQGTSDMQHNLKIKKEKMKRLTIDITENLHKKIKSECAKKGVKMADEIRRIIEKEF